jgi:putative hydrolase of the HAD superfamily
MFDFCASLRPRYRTAILSNSADGARREEQRRYGFSELVDVLVYSHEVGVAKPDPAIYRLTEERLGLTGAELVLVDDIQANVDAAVALGWAGVLHRTTASTISQVRAMLAR